MGTWEYRVVEKITNHPQIGEVVWHEIVEVYYDDDGKLDATSDKICPSADTVEDLREDLELMLVATNKPVISHKEFNQLSGIAVSFAECCNPSATLDKCIICGNIVHTCERDNPVDNDYRCPAHQDDIQDSDGDWFCSLNCYNMKHGE